MTSICLVYFKSLSLANLEAALYSVWRQDLSYVEEIIILDNDSPDSVEEIEGIKPDFPVPVQLLSYKHGDPTKTHSWSTNTAVSAVITPWVLFTRADYVLDFDLLERFLEIIKGKPEGWDGFLTSNVYHLIVDIEGCGRTHWKEYGPSALRSLPGAEASHTTIDSGVWMARRDSFFRAGGLDESLTAWGHAQTEFQYRMHRCGVEFAKINEVLFYHPEHAAPRDLDLANRQLAERGIDLKELWHRSDGPRVY